MPYQSLGQFLQRLEAEGELVRIKKEVDPLHEISAVITKLREPAVFCPNVKNSTIPVVGNVFGNLKKIELALECPRERLLQEFLHRRSMPLPPRVVDRGPVQEVILTGDQVDLTQLPVPWVNEKDGGRYIDCGIVVARDPEFGHNLSLHRIQLKGPRKTGIWLDHVQHLGTYYKRAQELNRPLEIAVVIGCDPVLYIASQVTAAIDVDEYTVAGSLRQEPVDLVRCQTVDILVPAHAEIVLEGRILPHLREQEGPFGEFPGTYGPQVQAPVVEYTALTRRANPIYQMLYQAKPPTENVYLTAIPKAADLYRVVKETVAEVRGVYLTPGGCGRYHAVVSIKKRTEGEPKLALAALLSSRISVKHAVVVDEDINIYDPHDVEWAIATRSQFDRDSIVITGAPQMLDPSTVHLEKRLTAKVGIDATRPLGVNFPETCAVPREVLEEVERNWKDYL